MNVERRRGNGRRVCHHFERGYATVDDHVGNGFRHQHGAVDIGVVQRGCRHRRVRQIAVAAVGIGPAGLVACVVGMEDGIVLLVVIIGPLRNAGPD